MFKYLFCTYQRQRPVYQYCPTCQSYPLGKYQYTFEKCSSNLKLKVFLIFFMIDAADFAIAAASCLPLRQHPVYHCGSVLSTIAAASCLPLRQRPVYHCGSILSTIAAASSLPLLPHMSHSKLSTKKIPTYIWKMFIKFEIKFMIDAADFASQLTLSAEQIFCRTVSLQIFAG